MVAGFFPSFTQWSMNARMVFGSVGKYGSPRDSQKAWKIAPSAFWARSVLAEYAPSAIACHSSKAANGPSRTGCGATGCGSNSDGLSVSFIFHSTTHRTIHAITVIIIVVNYN